MYVVIIKKLQKEGDTSEVTNAHPIVDFKLIFLEGQSTSSHFPYATLCITNSKDQETTFHILQL